MTDKELLGMQNKKKFSDEEIDFMVKNVVASFACENMVLTEEEIEALYKIGRGELDVDTYIKEIIKRDSTEED